MERISPTNRIISAIDRYSKYLTDFGNQQINIAERTTKLLEKKKLEEFSGQIQNRLKDVTSLSDLMKVTSSLITEATSNGLFEAIPLINQHSEVKIKEIGLGEQEKLIETSFNTLDPNAEVIVGNQLKTIGEVLKDPEVQKLSREAQYRYITNLARPEVSISGSIVNGQEQLSISKIHPTTKEVISTDVHNIYSKKGRLYYNEKGIEKYVPDKVIDELNQERYFILQRRLAQLNLDKEIKGINLNEALKMQELTYRMKQDLTRRAIDAKVREFIQLHPEDYDPNDPKYAEKISAVYEKFSNTISPNNIVDLATNENTKNIYSKVFNEQDYNQIKLIQESDNKVQEILILNQNYNKNVDFQNNYFNYKELLESLIDEDMLNKYADSKGIDKQELRAIIITFKNAKAINDNITVVNQVNEFYKSLSKTGKKK